MTIRTLILRSLLYHWRTNLAVVLGVAVAVAVLSGALLVGDSVRGSLRALVLERLGNTDHAVLSEGFFREELAAEIAQTGSAAPLIFSTGFVSVQGGDGNAGGVQVYGVDDRFWIFHESDVVAPSEREALISPALADDLGTGAGETILVRMQRPSDIPLESLHGRKEDASLTIRAAVRDVVARESLGEFSLQAQQGRVRAVFLPLGLLQDSLDVRGRVNAVLISGLPGADELERTVRDNAGLADLGIRLRILDTGAVALEADGGLIPDSIADASTEAGEEIGATTQPILTYLANTMRVGSREIPYSLVTAMERSELAPASPLEILLTDWAAHDLDARAGDVLTMDYFLWEDPGRLVTRSAEFTVAGIVPIGNGDPDLAPIYPGITDVSNMREWDPPFPIDLRRVRPIDEEYWERFVTTPKAFVSLQRGQELWASRYGNLTSIRFTPASGENIEEFRAGLQERLEARLDPLASGLAVRNVREESVAASRGATDFGEYFVYFSFFLVVSALILAALFFKLSVEQRIREIGLLRALGLPPAAVRRVFMGEGFALSLCGGLLGVAGAIFYAAGIVAALGTWWVGAVGTEDITLHVSSISLIGGASGGIVAAVVCIWFTLRGLRRASERSLLAGQLPADDSGAKGRAGPRLSVGAATVALLLMVAGGAGALDPAPGFFGSGFLFLVAVLAFLRARLSRPPSQGIAGQGWRPVSRLGARNASFRPARSIVAMATIASATFILISVDSFRKDGPGAGTGGYSLLAELLVPIVHDPNSAEGREALGLSDLSGVRIEPFRVRPGDDASCLNLYEPTNPRILAPSAGFVQRGGFVFRNSLAVTEAEHANPWLLLNRTESDGAIPVIADANSMTYVLHRSLGEDFVIANRDREVRLRFVAALADSVFQSELLMSEENFRSLFPEQEGYSFLLLDTQDENPAGTANALEDALANYSADATSVEARIAEFHRVENTYLSTFQMLGGLGLLLGTVGLAAVLLRNILERRRELALLRTMGYQQKHFFVMTLMENTLLLIGGLGTGVLCALIAIAPAVVERGGRLPAPALAAVLAMILISGLAISMLATIAALREAVLTALRSE